jgi:TonB family protein
MIAVASSSSEIDFAPAAPRAQPQAKSGEAITATAGGREGLPMASLFTFVLWAGLLTVGLVGLLIEPARMIRRPVAPPVVKAELLTVELTSESVLLPESGSPPPPAEPPPLLRSIVEPPLPALTAVASPDAAVAFALPVEGPVRVVDAAQASFSRAVESAPAPAAASVPVQAMFYGQGEGRQEAPEYPRQAKRERQEGAVGVQFSVGQNGRVVEAALSSPSPWSLLNEAALKVIRDRWRFRAGDLRLYEVSIRFELKR